VPAERRFPDLSLTGRNIHMSESDSLTISLCELLTLSAEHKIGRIADAAEGIKKPLDRIADALETIASTLSCLTAVVESDDGQRQVCTLRTHDVTPNWLAAYGGLNDA
jgi:hypothetical protein